MLNFQNFSNSDISENDKTKTYNSKAAFYALPKSFIINFVPLLSPTTLKVFIALTYFTDHLNIIKFPKLITYKKLMNMTGIKKIDTIRKAFKELEQLKLIGGFESGCGINNTKFYFTFDILHYRTDECPFDIDELEDYYKQFEYKEIEVNSKTKETSMPKNEHTPLPKNVYTINTINNNTIINSNSSNTEEIEINKDLIVLANNSVDFKKEFNEFCIKDSSSYREKTFYWILYHSSRLNLGFADVLESLKICNTKGKQGKMAYLIGIMQNKSRNLNNGILAAGKNIVYQALEYIKHRCGANLEYFKNISVSENNIIFEVNDDCDAVKDYCKLLTNDLSKRFNTEFNFNVQIA
jgi:hypothetical protein